MADIKHRSTFNILPGIIFIWSIFTIGKFSSHVISSCLQYGAIVFLMLWLVIDSIHVNRKINFPMRCLIIWVTFFGLLAIFYNGSTAVFIKVFLYILMLFFAIQLAFRVDTLLILKIIFFGCCMVSIVSMAIVFFLADIGVDQEKFLGCWRGVFEQKNALGRLSTLLTFCAAFLLFFDKRKIIKAISFFAIFLALFICYKSDSRTSIVICFLNVFLALVSFEIKRNGAFIKVSIGKVFLIILALIFLSILFLILNIEVYNLHSGIDGVKAFGYPVSLTGRVTIWFYGISNSMINNFYLGFGLDNFWTIKNASTFGLMQGMGDFYPNDSHNGFVDLLVQTGVIGTIIYASILFVPFVKIKGTDNMLTCLVSFSFLIFFIFSNITESYVTKSTNIINVMMMVFLCKIVSHRDATLHSMR